MDYIPDLHTLTVWLVDYGSLSLFVLLALGIVALPIPEETLMVIAGALMSNGTLNISTTIASAYLGSVCGITLSYALGRTAGLYFIHKYGKWIGLTEARLKKAHAWFEQFGKWSLIFGYFIPGIRHFTGFSAGATYLELRHFALFAYCGAFLWVTTFLSIGYFFGNYWPQFYQFIELKMEWASLFLIFLLAAGALTCWMAKR